MSVAAISTGGIEVVEKDELIGEPVVIRCDILPEHHERGVPVSLRHIAENLIVGPVFLDDVHDMPDQRGLARPRGNGDGRDAASHWRSPWSADLKVVVLRDCRGVAGELRLIGNGNHADRPSVGVDVSLLRIVPPAGACPQQRGNRKVLVIRAEGKGVRIPRGRNQPQDFSIRSRKNGHRVDPAARDIERGAV